MSDDQRSTYEQNLSFIKANVERLQRGEVSIDELETLTAQMNQALKFCEDRLAKTRLAVAETMKQSAPAAEC
ncbi:exodeoxyribonuclease VII small subunit [Pseudomonas luteola]